MTEAFNQIQTIQQAKEIISLLKIIMGEKKKITSTDYLLLCKCEPIMEKGPFTPESLALTNY